MNSHATEGSKLLLTALILSLSALQQHWLAGCPCKCDTPASLSKQPAAISATLHQHLEAL